MYSSLNTVSSSARESSFGSTRRSSSRRSLLRQSPETYKPQKFSTYSSSALRSQKLCAARKCRKYVVCKHGVLQFLRNTWQSRHSNQTLIDKVSNNAKMNHLEDFVAFNGRATSPTSRGTTYPGSILSQSTCYAHGAWQGSVCVFFLMPPAFNMHQSSLRAELQPA